MQLYTSHEHWQEYLQQFFPHFSQHWTSNKESLVQLNFESVVSRKFIIYDVLMSDL